MDLENTFPGRMVPRKLVNAAFRRCSSTPRLCRSASCTVRATLTAGNTRTVNPSFQLRFAEKKMQILRLFIPSQVNFYRFSICVDLTELKILCICKLYFVIYYFRYTIPAHSVSNKVYAIKLVYFVLHSTHTSLRDDNQYSFSPSPFQLHNKRKILSPTRAFHSRCDGVSMNKPKASGSKT